MVAGSAGGDMALTAGTLRITDACVFLEEADDEHSLLVWPADATEWSAELRAITFENRDGSTATLRDGERVTFGGGGDGVEESGIPGREWVGRIEWVAPPASSCPIEARWGVGEVIVHESE